MLTYSMTSLIGSIIDKWDRLGFNNRHEAAEAILTHEDWAKAWDLSDATLDDLEAVGKWREETLENNKIAASCE